MSFNPSEPRDLFGKWVHGGGHSAATGMHYSANGGNDLQGFLSAKYPGVKVAVSENPKRIVLHQVVVPKEERGKGVGSEFMKDLIAYADHKGKRIDLTPSSDFGGTVSRLKEFYKSFGFVENKGRNKDYEVSESMYRPPATMLDKVLGARPHGG